VASDTEASGGSRASAGAAHGQPTIRPSGWSRREFAALAAVAIAVPLAWWIGSTVMFHGNGFNDFHDFWLAAKLIAMGHSPYDKHALEALANTQGLHFVVGTGYSYPLPFAVAMIPFAALPFTVAVLAFTGLGLLLFGLTVAAWICWAHGSHVGLARRRLLLAAAAGLYPSVYGTVANGQAGLVLMPLLGFGAIAILDGRRRRGIVGGLAVGLAAIVKLTPGAMVVPLALGRRWAAAGALVIGAAGSLAIATVLAPWAGEGSGGLTALLEPDSYFTNQSINGIVSRLVLPSERTVPLWNHGFDPRLPMLILTGLFALATLGILWKSRVGLRDRRGLALGLGIALVAGLIGAPKGTYWNQVMVLVPAGLLIAVEVPDLRFGRLPRLDLVLLATWILGTSVQTWLWMYPPSKSVAFAPFATILTSSSTYGLLALWLVLARRLLSRPAMNLRLRTYSTC
jgi:Glycosyltransferase family 87